MAISPFSKPDDTKAYLEQQAAVQSQKATEYGTRGMTDKAQQAADAAAKASRAAASLGRQISGR